MILLGLTIAASLAASPGAGDAVAQAERLAHAALARPAAEASLADARRALALTQDFDPRRFVQANAKGELIEDAYREALARYRTHRALVYQAVGECLAQQSQARAATRYLRRALLLDAGEGRRAAFARALVRDDRAAEALDVIGQQPTATIGGDLLAVAQQAADAAAVPSLQAELDRARLAKLNVVPKPEPRDGPVIFGERLRLSTGAPFRLDEDGTTVVYAADPSCRSCTSDVEALGKIVPASVRILVAPAVPDQDRPLRQTLQLYQRSWPMILGGRADAFGSKAPIVWVIGRRGWSAAVVAPPFDRALPAVLELFTRRDLDETLPRAAWNRRAVVRRALPPAPGLIDETLAPGEDEPAPPEFEEALRAFRANKATEALRLLEKLEVKADGWLLSPEARLDRALCLAHAGQTERARGLLRAIGDSRFQDHVDAMLESLSPKAR
jgi:hypothetical protein